MPLPVSTSPVLRVAILLAALGGVACSTIPPGPSRMALPGTGKNFDQFRYDDSSCQQFSLQQSGGISANQAGNNSLATSAILGTALGTAVGAAVGGQQGAAVGAGTGLLVGTAAGTGAAATSSYSAQQRYDNAYTQCMYAKGHRVPLTGNLAAVTTPAAAPAANQALTRQAPPAPKRAYFPPPPPPASADGNSVSNIPPDYSKPN